MIDAGEAHNIGSDVVDVLDPLQSAQERDKGLTGPEVPELLGEAGESEDQDTDHQEEVLGPLVDVKAEDLVRPQHHPPQPVPPNAGLPARSPGNTARLHFVLPRLRFTHHLRRSSSTWRMPKAMAPAVR